MTSSPITEMILPSFSGDFSALVTQITSAFSIPQLQRKRSTRARRKSAWAVVWRGLLPPLHPTDQSGSYLRVHTEDSWPMAWFVCCLGWAEHSHTFWPWRGHGGERLVRTCQCITVLSTKGNFFRPESGQHFIDGS